MNPGRAFIPSPAATRPPVEDASPVVSEDVGPLLAQAASLRDEQPLDEATRALWAEAVSRALTGQASAKAS